MIFERELRDAAEAVERVLGLSRDQKRVTITAVDLSKVSENCCVVLNWDDKEPTAAEMSQIRTTLLRQKPEIAHVPIVVLRKGQTLTVEQLPPRSEKQIIDDFRKLADSKQQQGQLTEGQSQPAEATQ